MKIKIVVYMLLREKLGWREKTIEIPKSKVTLREVLDKVPDLRDAIGSAIHDYLILVNGVNVRLKKGLDTEITSDAEIAIFPPGGGGVED